MTTEQLPNIQWVKLSKLKLNPNNPRLIKDEPFLKLVKSMREKPHFIKYKPLIVDDYQGNLILAGNQRYRSAKELGWTQIACIFTSDLTPEEKDELMIRDNTHSGEHDYNILSTFWDAETLEDWGVPIYLNEEITPIDLTSNQEPSESEETTSKCPECGK